MATRRAELGSPGEEDQDRKPCVFPRKPQPWAARRNCRASCRSGSRCPPSTACQGHVGAPAKGWDGRERVGAAPACFPKENLPPTSGRSQSPCQNWGCSLQRVHRPCALSCAQASFLPPGWTIRGCCSANMLKTMPSPPQEELFRHPAWCWLEGQPRACPLQPLLTTVPLSISSLLACWHVSAIARRERRGKQGLLHHQGMLPESATSPP